MIEIQSPASDIRREAILHRMLPQRWKPYGRLARLDRPIGTWLLLVPCWWGLMLAVGAGQGPGGWTALWYGLLFGLGAILMRGAGCTWNDITDRDFDGRVARTADRPIPAGDVTVRQARLFMAGLMLVSLVILLQFNWMAVAVGAASLLLVFPYPFMKRITYWPQAWLGLTFNWGALLGWVAASGALGWPPVLLYAAGLSWTLAYDTIYAHQDKEDDALIGVKSTALKFGRASRPIITGFFLLAAVLIGLAGWLAGLGWAFWAGLAAFAGHAIWQVSSIDFGDPADCLRKFRSNRDAALLLLAGMIADAALRGLL